MKLNPKFPIYLPGIENANNLNKTIIGANLREDITTIAHYISNKDGISQKTSKEFITKDFTCFSSLLSEFLANENLSHADRLGISVPGPVIDGKSFPERIGWNLDVVEIKEKFDFQAVYMLNDQEAASYGIALVEENEIECIYPGNPEEKGNVAILSPGNGLGEAGCFFDGKYLRPFATEGGHSEFSPRTNVEVEFYQYLNNIYGIVSWENVLSKKGLYNIYRFLRDVKRHPEPEGLAEKLANGDFLTEIYKGATEEKIGICKITLDTFLEFLSREANNLTLKLKATGGLLITGDIPRVLKKYLDKEKFYQKFIMSDKMEVLLGCTPIYLLDTEKTNINGIALYSAFYNN